MKIDLDSDRNLFIVSESKIEDFTLESWWENLRKNEVSFGIKTSFGTKSSISDLGRKKLFS